jgi:hypothetical protein
MQKLSLAILRQRQQVCFSKVKTIQKANYKKITNNFSTNVSQENLTTISQDYFTGSFLS